MNPQRPLSELPPGQSSWFEPYNPAAAPASALPQETVPSKLVEVTPSEIPINWALSVERSTIESIPDLEPGLATRGLRRVVEFGRSLFSKKLWDSAKVKIASLGSASLADMVTYQPVHVKTA